MDKAKAIDVLKDFNDYRRNEGIYDVDEPCEPKFKASEIGEAVDIAICALTEFDGKSTIIDAVVAESGISLEQIRSKSREREVVVAREVAASLLRKEGYMLREVGELINRAHSTVMHLCEEADYWFADQDQFSRELRLLNRVKRRCGKE